jgi:hypothetical protein
MIEIYLDRCKLEIYSRIIIIIIIILPALQSVTNLDFLYDWSPLVLILCLSSPFSRAH